MMYGNSRRLLAVGLFSAMAFVLVLPTGAASAAVLLVCSLTFLLLGGCGFAIEGGIARHERWFLASMVMYPALVVLSMAINSRTIEWNGFDTPSRFLFVPLIYWAVRKSSVGPGAMVSGSIIGAIGAGTLAIFQWSVMGYDRPPGFVNSIPFADISLMLVCLATTPIRLSNTLRLLRFPGIGLGLIAVVLAQTRGAWIAIPILVCIAMEWFPGRRSLLIRRFIFLTILLGAVLVVVAVLWEDTPTISRSLDGRYPELRLSSLMIRLETWKVAWAIFCDNPWFGVGIDGYGLEAGRLLEGSGLPPPGLESATSHAHNDFLHLGATLGIPGILAYLVPLTLLYYIGGVCCRRNLITIGVLLKLFSTGQLIFSLTQTQLSHNVSATFFAMTAAILVALGFNELQRRQDACDALPVDPPGTREPDSLHLDCTRCESSPGVQEYRFAAS